MKKTISILLAIALMLCLALPTLANTEKKTDITYTHVVVLLPSYTVEIPADLALQTGDNYIQILLGDVENLGDDQVVVYLVDSGNFGGTGIQNFRNNFRLRGVTTNNVLRYTLHNKYGVVEQDVAIGSPLAWLDDSDSHDDLLLRIDPDHAAQQPSDEYHGFITFGITLLSLFEQ